MYYKNYIVVYTWYNYTIVKFTKVMPKINQENIYQFLTSPDFKNWFLDRFEGKKNPATL